MEYEIVLETRKHGSLGAFHLHTVFIESGVVEEAIGLAVDRCHEKGYEVRMIVSCNPLEEKTFSVTFNAEINGVIGRTSSLVGATNRNEAIKKVFDKLSANGYNVRELCRCKEVNIDFLFNE